MNELVLLFGNKGLYELFCFHVKDKKDTNCLLNFRLRTNQRFVEAFSWQQASNWCLDFNNDSPRNYESRGKHTTVLKSRYFIHAITRWNMNALN